MSYGIVYRAYLKDERSYVGQTTRSLRERMHVHRCIAKSINTHFANAIKRYGMEAFKWEILQECPNQKSLDAAERQWIKHYDSIESGFNLKTGGSYGKHSEETKEKIRKSKLGKKNPMYGKSPLWKGEKLPWSEKIPSKFKNGHIPWNKDLSKEQQPRYGKECSEKQKKKISKANKGSNNGMSFLTEEVVECMRRDYETGNFLVKEIAQKYGVSRPHASNILNKKAWK